MAGDPYAEPEPPPRRAPGEYAWTVRFNPIDLLFGQGTAGVQYAVAGPLTIGVAPTYLFNGAVYDNQGLDRKGWGLAGQVELWIDGRPYRGMFLRGQLSHQQATYSFSTGAKDVPANASYSNSVGQNFAGLLIGSQSIHGGWFTFTTGIGVEKNLSYSKTNTIDCPVTLSDGTVTRGDCSVGAGLGGGWDILGDISIGAVF